MKRFYSISISGPLLACLFAIIIHTWVCAQDNPVKVKYKMIEKLESSGNYTQAIVLLKQLVALEPGNPNFNFKLAIDLIESNSSENTLEYLEVASRNITDKYVSSYDNPAAPPLALKHLVKEYMLNNKFKEALATLEKYKTYVSPKDKQEQKSIAMRREYCNTGVELMKKPIRLRQLDFGANFIANCTAHSPVFSPD